MRIILSCLLVLSLFSPLLAKAQVTPFFQTGFVEGEQLKEGQLEGLVFDEQALHLAPDAQQGVYTSPEIPTAPFEYLVLSWNGSTPGDSSLKVEARLWHREEAAWTDWLSWGNWHLAPGRSSRSSNTSLAVLSDDTAWVTGDNTRSDKLQLRTTLTGQGASLRRLAYTTRDTAIPERTIDASHSGTPGGDVIAYSQYIRESTIAGVMCSAVTICTQLNLLGEDYLSEEIALHQYDAGMNGFGNWSFNVALAGELGYKSYVTYADEEQLLTLLDQGRPVGMSVKYSDKPGGNYPYLEGAPITTPGHLITVRGYEIVDGQRWYLVSDSAAPTDQEALKRYRGSQLMDAWVNRILYVVEQKEVDQVVITRTKATMVPAEKEGVWQLLDPVPASVKMGFASAARNRAGGGYLLYTLEGQPGHFFDVKLVGNRQVKFPEGVDMNKVTLYVMTNLASTYVVTAGK